MANDVSGLVDAFGNPIASSSLMRPQTTDLARAASGLQGGRYTQMEYEGAGDTVRALTPARVDAILRNSVRLHLGEQAQLFAQMEERDAHLAAEMAKRRRAILTCSWSVQPAQGTGKRGEMLARAAQTYIDAVPDFEDLLLDLMDAVGNGFAALELQWQQVGGSAAPEWLVQAARHKPQSFFTLRGDCPPPGERSDLRLIDDTLGAATSSSGLRGAMVQPGIELRPFGWLVHLHRSRSGPLARAGLYRGLLWPYIIKHFGERDWAEFLESYGQPLRTAQYPNNATPQQKSALLRSLLALGHNGAGIFPEGMAIELHDAVGGQSEGFEKLVERMDRLQSKLILGQTLSAGSDRSGSYALGQVHREVQMDILKSDALQLAGTLTRELVYPLLALNRGLQDVRECPKFVFDVDETEDLKGLAAVIEPLARGGVQIPVSWVHKKFGIPVPVDGEDVLQPVAAPAPFGQGGGDQPAANAGLPMQQRKGLAALAGLSADATAKRIALARRAGADVATGLADRLAVEAARPMQAMLAQIEAVVEQAESLEALQADLLALYGAMRPDQLTAALELGFAAAKLRGMAEVVDEVDEAAS